MKKQYGWRVGRTCFAIKDLYTAKLNCPIFYGNVFHE